MYLENLNSFTLTDISLKIGSYPMNTLYGRKTTSREIPLVHRQEIQSISTEKGTTCFILVMFLLCMRDWTE